MRPAAQMPAVSQPFRPDKKHGIAFSIPDGRDSKAPAPRPLFSAEPQIPCLLLGLFGNRTEDGNDCLIIEFVFFALSFSRFPVLGFFELAGDLVP
jgi:hypothetical protein